MKSLKRIRKRAGRCYELALKVMTEEPGAEKFTLVHGRGPLGVPHAWVETGDGRVYDAVADSYTPIDEYQCSAERRYTQAEARQAMLENRTSGPWHYVIHGGYGGDAPVPIGILMERGEAGYDAFDATERFLGNFSDPGSAGDAVFAAAHETPPAQLPLLAEADS
jgi:hypothetical protein